MKTQEHKTPATPSRQEDQAKHTPFFDPSGENAFFPPQLQRQIKPASSIVNDAALEQEADVMADQAVKRSEGKSLQGIHHRVAPSIQPKHGDREQEDELQKKEKESAPQALTQKTDDGILGVSPQFAVQLKASDGKGAALPDESKLSMGNAFGADFSPVRIHDGKEAADMSEAIGANAFTHGNDIFFNRGQFAPDTRQGKHLLAHELTHTLQQAGTIQRKTTQEEKKVGEYTDSGIPYSKPFKIDEYQTTTSGSNVSKYNYWYNQITSIYDWSGIKFYVHPPFDLDNDAYNAILSKAWDLRPAIVPTAAIPDSITEVTLIPLTPPAATGVATKKYHLECFFTYRFDVAKNKPAFQLTTKEIFEETSPFLEIDKLATSTGEIDQHIRDKFKTAFPFHFPDNNDLKVYLSKHPEVEKPLAAYIQSEYNKFKKSKKEWDNVSKQPLSLNETVADKSEKITIVLSMDMAETRITHLELSYFAQKNSVLPTGYDTKDYADYQLEEYQQKHPTETEKPGSIVGLDAISDANERAIVKNVAVDIFTSEGTDKKTGITKKYYRDTEVDQIIPVSADLSDPAKTELLYYTFIVHKPDADNLINITVKKVGKKGDAIVADPENPSITRSPGYAENAYDTKNAETPAKLIKWVLARYRGIKEADIQGATVADITQKINAIIVAKSGSPEWFKNNYTITLLNATEAVEQLKKLDKKKVLEKLEKLKADNPEASEAKLLGLKDFTSDELTNLELTLQRISVPLLKKLEGVNFIRQNENPGLAGLTQSTGNSYNPHTGAIVEASRSTISLYNSAFSQKDVSFLGGNKGINPGQVSTPSHELGHVISHVIPGNNVNNPEYLATFNKFYDDLDLTPVTAYAKGTSLGVTSSPDKEYFPEAFMLFLNDPEWLLNNQYQTYFWFLFLQERGAPPTLAQAKSLISVWEGAILGGNLGIESAKAIYYLWNEYRIKKSGVPDAANTATLLIISSEFLLDKKRHIRSDEAKSIVANWMAFVAKNKQQPTSAEVKAFW